MTLKPGDLLAFYPGGRTHDEVHINLVLKLTPGEAYDFQLWSFNKKRKFNENFAAIGKSYEKIN